MVAGYCSPVNKVINTIEDKGLDTWQENIGYEWTINVGLISLLSLAMVCFSGKMVADEAEDIIATGTMVINKISDGYFEAAIKATRIDQERHYLLGFKSGWTFKNTYILGGAAYRTTDILKHSGKPLTYGGILLAYVARIKPPKLVHFGVLIGGGSLDDSASLTGFSVFEPSIAVLLAPKRIYKSRAGIALGASYRHINLQKNQCAGCRRLGGVAFHVSLVFGAF